MRQLRQLRAVYAGGAGTWFFCLLPTAVQGDGSARQTVVLLGLLAVFLVLLLWSTWCLWEAGTRRSADRAGGRANAQAERSWWSDGRHGAGPWGGGGPGSGFRADGYARDPAAGRSRRKGTGATRT
ncbi:hypothetical protein [Streptomyces sp. enrichment culture]|uniref:hypothetical protein n=1 Tax=Streptomyces sp. enrichment culture TaxID=1795815 RepID=UPI003F56B211